MSDDFGGKSYEMDKKEGENEESGEEEAEELEKEMGETGENGDTLDQKVFVLFIVYDLSFRNEETKLNWNFSK